MMKTGFKFSLLRRGLLSVLVLTVGILMVPVGVKWYTRSVTGDNLSRMSSKEFGIILGAGIRPNSKPGFLLKKRLDDAVHLYNNKKIKKILVSGDNGKKSYDEISVMASYLQRNGIPKDIIFGDYAGFDTYSTMSRAKKVFGIKSAIVITQKFHLPRAVFLAKMNRINAAGYSTSAHGANKYRVREWFATIKSVFDLSVGRKPKFNKGRIDVNGYGNIKQ